MRRYPVLTKSTKGLKLSIYLFFIAVSVFYSAGLYAAQGLQKNKLPPDLRIVVDISGSMKQNDPLNLRVPALELLVKLLPEGSRAGIWTFGKYVNALVHHGDVDDRWRKYALQQAQNINSVGLYTNIPASLKKVGFDLDVDDTQYQRFVILLTDGMVDVDKNPELNKVARKNIIKKIIPQFFAANITIHTLALSENADRHLLRKLAVGTDGHAEVAETAEELMKVFVNIFDQSAATEQLPLEGNKFSVDSSVEEFTVLLFKKPGSEATVLIEPGEKEYHHPATDPDVKWHRAKRYDLITVQRPIEGEWEVKAEIDDASRVTVVSDLSMAVKRLPNNIYEGESHELILAFQENGKNITRKEFLELLSFKVICKDLASGQQLNIPVKNSDIPANGVFKIPFINLKKPGKYDLILTAETKTFAREFKQSLSYRRLFTARVKEQNGIDGDNQYHIDISTDSHNIDNDSVSIIAKIKAVDGASSIRTASLVEDKLWRIVLTDVSEKTQYIISIKVDGNTKDGDDFNMSLPDISIETSGNVIELDENQPQEVEEPEDITEQDLIDENTDEEQAKDEELQLDDIKDEEFDEEKVKEEELGALEEEKPIVDKKVKEEFAEESDKKPEKQKTKADDDEESTGIGMIVGIVAVNFLLLGLFYLAYVHFLKKKNVDIFSDISDDIIQEAVAEAEVDANESIEQNVEGDASPDENDKTIVVAPSPEITDIATDNKVVDVLEDFPELTDSNEFSIDDSDFDTNMDFGDELDDK